MKKLLSAIGVLTIAATSLNVVACNDTTISKEDPDHKKIVTAINSAHYKTEIPFKLPIEKLSTIINSEFIKEQLNNEIQSIFQNRSFKFHKIIIDGRDLTAEDLEIKGTFAAKIKYDYSTIRNQITDINLTIKVLDQQIVDAIKANITNFREDWRTIEYVILAEDFIKKAFLIAHLAVIEILPDYLKWDYRYDWLEIKTITHEGEDLKDDNFKREGTINITFNFDYGTSKNQNVTMQFIKKFKTDSNYVH